MRIFKEQTIVNDYKDYPKFTGRNVSIKEISEATGKSDEYIREGIKQGLFKFGFALKREGKMQYSFMCPDKLVWEQLGYFNEAYSQEEE